MTRPRSVLACAFVVMAAALRAEQLPPEPTVAPVFRATADAVRVDVSVRRQGRPVTNLAEPDFSVLDNGVAQRISDLSYEKMPIDVTVAFDVSSSVTGVVLQELRDAVNQLRARLRPGDRLKLMTFNMRVRRLLDFTDGAMDTKTVFAQVIPNGTTALFDTLAVALTSAAPIDRRQLVITFSDGQDTGSVSDRPALLEVARHTTPTLAFVIPTPVAGPGGVASALALAPYRELAAETGGIVLNPGLDLAEAFARVLDEFRSVYVLHYVPAGVVRTGYHELEVRVARPGTFEIRARRGYAEN